MRCDVLTIFPAVVEAYTSVGVLGKAGIDGVLDVRAYDLRRWAINRYGQVDDQPYGGGPGMVLLAPVVIPAVRELVGDDSSAHIVLPDPRGRLFCDTVARELARHERLVIVCGRYEGFDERVFTTLQADEISLGDYVLSGGELAALAILDAVARHLPGVVGDPDSVAADSFTSGLLDHPVYSRPRLFEGQDVPEILFSGHHEHIRRWRLTEAIRRTLRLRPDLIQAEWANFPAQTRRLVMEIASEEGLEAILAGCP